LSKVYDLFRDISTDLMDMEEKRKVDLGIVPKLSSLAKEYSKKERFWAEKDISVDAGFPAFHAARNSKMVVERIVDRFEKQNKDENPKIVYETEQLIPLLLEVFSRLKKAEETLPRIEFDSPRQLFEVTKKLRNTASEVSMLPSLADELKHVNRQVLTEEFENLRKRWMLEILDM